MNSSIPVLSPPSWAIGGHLQTLWGHFLPSPQYLTRGELNFVQLVDGDQLAIRIQDRGSPVVVSLYHGLSGDISSDYMQRTARICEYLNLSCVLVNHRGAGEGFGLAVKPYHSGIAEDISAVLDFLKNRFPGTRQIAVGFSMSGNILLNLVSGNRGSTVPEAAVSVNAPIRLLNSSLKLKSGFNRFYDMRFIRLLTHQFKHKQKLNLLDPALKISPLATVWDMDQIFTAPLCGFKSREDYYESCSAFAHTHKIKIPTWILTASDDPFVDVRDYQNAKWSQQVQLRIEKHGGHLGYLDSHLDPRFGRRWLDRYLLAALSHLSEEIL